MNHPKVLAEYQEIEEALRFERDEAVSSYKQLVEPRMLKRVLLGMSIQMWSQLSGMNVMMYYIVYLMEGQSSHLTNPVLKRANTKYRCEYSFSTPHSLHPVHLECNLDPSRHHVPRSLRSSTSNAHRVIPDDDFPLRRWSPASNLW